MEPIITPEETNLTPKPICPYIGLKNDALTCYQTPSGFNYCQYVKEPAPVQLRHQRQYCLSPEHLQCPVLQASLQELPSALKARATPKPGRRRLYSWLVVGLFLAAAAAALIYWDFFPKPVNSLAGRAFTTSPANTTTSTLQVHAGSQTTTVERKDPTPLPAAATPTPLRGYAGDGLATPLGIDHGYIIHRVAADESLSAIANLYQTSRDAILAVNRNENNWVIWQNDILVIPIKIIEPEQLQPLTAVYVDTYHFIADFASEYSCSEIDIRKLNAIPDDDTILQPGQWLLIPGIVDFDFHRVLTPTPAFFDQTNSQQLGLKGEYLLYQVVQEETLDKISQLFNSSPEALAKLNGISSETVLDPGQMLVIRPNYRLPLLANRVYVFHVISPIQSAILTEHMGWDHSKFLSVNQYGSQNSVLLSNQWVIYTETQ